MKKILLILIAIICLTGCEKENDDEVNEYLKSNFPNDTFEIVSKEKVEKIPDLCPAETKKEDKPDVSEGRKYTIKSTKTGYEFTAWDILGGGYEYPCAVEFKDDYRDSVIKVLVSKFNDERIKESNGSLVMKYEDFNSTEELCDTLSKFYEQSNNNGLDIFSVNEHYVTANINVGKNEYMVFVSLKGDSKEDMVKLIDDQLDVWRSRENLE